MRRSNEPVNYHATVESALQNYVTNNKPEEIGTIKPMLDSHIKEHLASHYDGFRIRGIKAEDIKLDGKYLIKRKGTAEMNIPLGTFFYPYTMSMNIDCTQLIEEITFGDHTLFLKIPTFYGNLYFCAVGFDYVSQERTVHMTTDVKYSDELRRLTIVFSAPPEDARKKCIHALLRVEPYICVQCGRHVPKMKKCKGCWEGLGICVRYCSAECQRTNYRSVHRRICGCKPDIALKKGIAQEFLARTPKAQELTRISLKDSEKTA
jgi:hypothetical protein